MMCDTDDVSALASRQRRILCAIGSVQRWLVKVPTCGPLKPSRGNANLNTTAIYVQANDAKQR
jgi:hypothetical protein